MRAPLIVLTTLLTAAATQADAQSYTLRPFTIPGATSVAVAGIADSGLATGSYVSPAQPNGAGFVGHRGAVTTMVLLGAPNAGYSARIRADPHRHQQPRHRRRWLL